MAMRWSPQLWASPPVRRSVPHTVRPSGSCRTRPPRAVSAADTEARRSLSLSRSRAAPVKRVHFPGCRAAANASGGSRSGISVRSTTSGRHRHSAPAARSPCMESRRRPVTSTGQPRAAIASQKAAADQSGSGSMGTGRNLCPPGTKKPPGLSSMTMPHRSSTARVRSTYGREARGPVRTSSESAARPGRVISRPETSWEVRLPSTGMRPGERGRVTRRPFSVGARPQSPGRGRDSSRRVPVNRVPTWPRAMARGRRNRRVLPLAPQSMTGSGW